MSSGNWIVDNLNNALGTWNNKLAEIWNLITQSPETFKGGAIWNVIVKIHGAVMAVGLGLLVLFFVVGFVKTIGSFAEMKRPEVVIKVFIRFILAKAAVTYGLDIMMALFRIVQGLVSTIMGAAGIGGGTPAVLPQTIIDSIYKIHRIVWLIKLRVIFGTHSKRRGKGYLVLMGIFRRLNGRCHRLNPQ